MDKRNLKRLVTLLSVPLVCSLPINVTASDKIIWGGYFSAGVGKTNKEDTSYNTPVGGTDFDDSVSFEPLTRIGLQGIIPIDDNMRGTFQITGRNDSVTSTSSTNGKKFNAEFEWANITYDVSDELSLQAGKFVLPVYYYSDFYNVGLAYDWVAPPAEVYVAPSATEGVLARYSTYVGDYELTAQAWSSAYTGVGIQERDVLGMALSFGKEELLFRFMTLEGELKFNAAGDYTDFQYTAFALVSEIGNFRFVSELATADVDNNTDARDSWYASVAYRLGKFTPVLTYSTNEDNPFLSSQSPSYFYAKEAYTYGLSYELSIQSKLKLEYKDIKMDDESENASHNLISASIDTVF
ncbi:hypothetical protein [Marinomonas sp. THO17]|uniref:hypothetical protein n=1 Tax=Marinomonas sp. THO17 TaxID=3149048 RepID=UPI00336BF1EE